VSQFESKKRPVEVSLLRYGFKSSAPLSQLEFFSMNLNIYSGNVVMELEYNKII
jgi:hypothetical protein